MKRKKLKIFFTIIFTLTYLSVFFSNYITLAFDDTLSIIDDPATNPPDSEITKIVNPILTIIQTITIGVALGLIVNDGIKMITTTDNSEKANLQRKIVYYFIGSFLIFTPVTIIKILTETTKPMTDVLKT